MRLYGQQLLRRTSAHGKPHIYQSEFSDAEDDYTGRFWLMPIGQELFSLIMEDWAIWLRWEAAFQHGKATLQTHPALPEDRPRHDELRQAIGDQLQADPEHSVLKSARLRGTRWSDLQVQWLDPIRVACFG
jgi:hypothetical protein